MLNEESQQKDEGHTLKTKPLLRRNKASKNGGEGVKIPITKVSKEDGQKFGYRLWDPVNKRIIRKAQLRRFTRKRQPSRRYSPNDYCLCFGNGKPILERYTDSDMAGDVDTRKSISGYLIAFAEGAVSWQSRLQKCIALSTTEAEYIAITEGLSNKASGHDSVGSGEHGHGRGISQRGGTSYRGRSRSRGSYSQNGYGRGSYSQTGYGRGKSNVQCFQCRKFGHYSSECTNKRENYANLAEASDDIIEEPTLLIVHNDSVEKNNVWYLDSGASNHMCGRKEYFVNLKEEIGGLVSLGDGSKLQVAGRGQIQIYQKDGKIRYISDVYYIPSMKSNILSLSQLLEKGDIIHMEDNQLYLRNASGQLIARPINFEQAVTEECWKTAMEEEMMSINKNDTWELSSLPPNQQAIGLMGYSDSDWGRDPEERKSTTGYVFYFGSTAFTWTSKKQPIVALSSCEAEYVAVSFIVCEAIWLRNLLAGLNHTQEGSTMIYVDNKSAIELSKNPIQHGRSKHIDTRFHFLRAEDN
ncbi:hypothetical protein ACOSQ3_020951 [Xanthoceras sorbifolium]